MPSTGGVKLGSSYDEARTRKTNAEAQIAEIELEKVRGELVPAEDVVSAWNDVLGALKSKLMSIPTKGAPILATEAQAGVCQKILEDLITEALEELSNYEPSSDPTKTTVLPSDDGDADAETAAPPKRKRMGRPKKTARLTK
tara:strand:- start:466 stop:891 length:426 start_codon:yes stop_codon:yes gene_type:complete